MNQSHPINKDSKPSFIMAPLGVRIGPCVVAGFFILIFFWAHSKPDLNHREWLYSCTIIMVVLSIYSAIAANFWKVEFLRDSLTLNTIYSKQVIAWSSIKSVTEREATTGRFLVNIVIKLHNGTEVETRNFHFKFGNQLKLEITRRLDCSR